MRISSKQMFNTRLFHTHSFLDDAVNKWMLRWITLFTRNYIQRPLLTIKTIYLSRKKVQHKYFDCRVRLKMSSVLVLLGLLFTHYSRSTARIFFTAESGWVGACARSEETSHIKHTWCSQAFIAAMYTIHKQAIASIERPQNMACNIHKDTFIEQI